MKMIRSFILVVFHCPEWYRSSHNIISYTHEMFALRYKYISNTYVLNERMDPIHSTFIMYVCMHMNDDDKRVFKEHRIQEGIQTE